MRTCYKCPCSCVEARSYTLFIHTTDYYTAGASYTTDGPECIWLLQALSSVKLEYLLLVSASPTQKL